MGTFSTTKFLKNNAGTLTEEAAIVTSTGPSDANKIPALNSFGVLDPSFVGAGKPSVLIGTVVAVAFSFVPAGWLACDGGIKNVADYPELFGVIGAIYGGDGDTTFGLPDLRGRTVTGAGDGSGLTPITLGGIGGVNAAPVLSTGTATVDIAEANLPAHTHEATTHVKVGTSTTGTYAIANGNLGLTSTISSGGTSAFIYLPPGASPGAQYDLGNVTTGIANTGSGTTLNAPVNTTGSADVMQPYLGLNYIIASAGISPVAP